MPDLGAGIPTCTDKQQLLLLLEVQDCQAGNCGTMALQGADTDDAGSLWECTAVHTGGMVLLQGAHPDGLQAESESIQQQLQ